MLTIADSSPAFEHNLAKVESKSELWPLLLLLAILLLPLDVGVRRVAVSKRDVARALEVARQRMGWLPKPLPAAPGASTSDMAALFGAKARTNDRTRSKGAISDSERATYPVSYAHSEGETEQPDRSWAQDVQLTGREGRTTPASEVQASAGAAPGTAPPEPQAGDDSLAARLRTAREQRK